MKIILLIPTLLLSASCTTSDLVERPSFFDRLFQKKPKAEKYTARITYYSVGQDKWGDKVACPKTYRAKEGITVAAHPNFKFGTKVHIPKLKGVIGDGDFIVQDRGSWVTSKKAAKGKAYVFDVYTRSPKERKRHAYNRPMYMDVYVYKEEEKEVQ